MDFADEHYVKLFTPDTVTWKLWPWQAKCLLPLLARKVDPAGFMPCGLHDPAVAVAAMVEIPLEVVKPGLEAMLGTGTIELVGRQILLVNFVSAQESRKTDKQKAKDYREAKKARARADAISNIAQSQDTTVTPRHTASPGVTPGYPPALPCPALPDPRTTTAPRKRAAAKSGSPKTEEPPDPRHQAFVDGLDETFKRRRGTGYPWAGKDFAIVKRLLQRKPGDEKWPTDLLHAWGRALLATHPDCRSIEAFERDLPRYLGTGPPSTAGPIKGAATAADTDWSNAKKGDNARELFGDTP